MGTVIDGFVTRTTGVGNGISSRYLVDVSSAPKPLEGPATCVFRDPNPGGPSCGAVPSEKGAQIVSFSEAF